MKNFFAALAMALVLSFGTLSGAVAADVYVNGYTKQNGTYVAPHYRSSPNSTRDDNFSTKGNSNPYTGSTGTKPRDADVSPFGSSGSSNSLGGGQPSGMAPKRSSGSGLYGN